MVKYCLECLIYHFIIETKMKNKGSQEAKKIIIKSDVQTPSWSCCQACFVVVIYTY